MANIFKQQKDINEHPNRNNFDLSRKSNVSMKMGTIYPVFCQPVVPGDSFDINVAYNMKLMPVVFPVQTKMRAHMHFFYVRNKNLWKNWQNWISNLSSNQNTPHPFIAPDDVQVKTGSIYDFLGVPTTYVGDLSSTSLARFVPTSYGRPSSALWFTTNRSFTAGTLLSDVVRRYTNELAKIPCTVCEVTNPLDDDVLQFHFGDFKYEFAERWNTISFHSPDSNVNFFVGDSLDTAEVFASLYDISFNQPLYLTSLIKDAINNYLSNGQKVFIVQTIGSSFLDVDEDVIQVCNGQTILFSNDWFNSGYSYGSPSIPQFQQYSDSGLELFKNKLHLNALPFRACESIYNAFYRNNVIDPLKDENDQPIYNKYLVNDGDGLDTFDYKLHQRNYELDFLTSALPSPQQGVAPLVGMTALGDITIEDENGLTTAHAEIDNDGTISKVVLTSPAASNEHARTAMNIAASGMSINDFRNTNALQRLLETNIRKGYRYLDFIAGHFGKEPEYRELDMPEFIGGFSRDVNVSTVVSQADTLGSDSGAALGQYGGYASLVDGSNHDIRHYCDDYGYIIGMMSVVPTPCYSQLLNKHMIAPDNFLDYYFPEFSQTGLQPILYKEVAPIQAEIQHLLDQSTDLSDTFGYQRPNYDMVSAVDEVHGEFRASLRSFVINRIFATRPELGHDFIAINPSEVNDIFVDTNPDDDTIIGEIGFSVFAKRPVPRVVIPNLGR